MNFTYINGIPATISYDGMTFYYVVNGQGDITGITDSSGNVQVRYYYDAWGVSTSVYSDDATYGLTLATINPLRYRGYVYDWEVGLYYLQSRYYIPEIGRFVNADDYPSTGQGFTGSNMFAYCGNNPVSRADNCGEWWHIAIGAVVGAAVSFVSSVADDVISGKEVNWGAAAASAAFGAASGFLAATGLPPVAQIAGGAALSAGENFVDQGIRNGFDEIDTTKVAVSAVVGGVTSISNGVSKSTKNHLYKQVDIAKKRITNELKHNTGKSFLSVATPTMKYYFSQTNTLFYKPLLDNAKNDFAFSVGKSFGENLFIKGY